MSTHVLLFDDATASGWQPFALTRPIGDLLFGALSFAARAEAVLGLPCTGHIAAEGLLGFDEAGCGPVIDASRLATDRPRLFLSSRVVLDWEAHLETGDASQRIIVGDEPAGWYAPAGSPAPPAEFLADPRASAARADGDRVLPGRVLANVWQLMTENAEQIARDWVGSGRKQRPHHRVSAEAVGVFVGGRPDAHSPVPYEVIGGEPNLLRVDPAGVAVEPYVLFDVSGGPIWIEPGVTIRAFTRLAGPAFIGRATTLLGGSIAGASIGPHCRVRGEVEASVVLGYTNKAHDGFLGHAYVGRWVNLGALTTNSDLKNNYGTVRLPGPHGEVDTGERKIGCFLGDHVKTAIGTMIGTGTVVGAGSNLFGDGSPSTRVEPFAWGSSGAEVYDLDRFLATAEIAMGRREIALTPGNRAVLSRAWHATAGARAGRAS